MWKTRAGLTLFGFLGIALGIGAIGIAREAVWLAAFGTEATARIKEIYQQNIDEAGGWFIVYEYSASGREYTGAAPASSTDKVGGNVEIYYLPKSPDVSNTKREVRFGKVLGPIGVFPAGMIFLATGIWLLAKAFFAPSAELMPGEESPD